MGRNIDKEKLGVVIEALMEKKLETKDLLARGIPKKTLHRILTEYLGPWGLVEKRGKYWMWYTYLTEYNANELPFIVKHSKQLLPGLNALLEYRPQGRYQTNNTTSDYASPEEIDLLKKYVESHLYTEPVYESIYTNLVKFKNLKSKLEKISTKEIDKILRGLSGKILTPDRGFSGKILMPDSFKLDVLKPEPSKSWFLPALFPEWKLHPYPEDVPYLLGPFKTEEEILDLLSVLEVRPNSVFKTKKRKEWFVIGPVHQALNSQKDLKTLDEFIQTRNLMMNVYQEFAGQIMALIMRVEADQPLRGKCGGCPNFKISEQPKK